MIGRQILRKLLYPAVLTVFVGSIALAIPASAQDDNNNSSESSSGPSSQELNNEAVRSDEKAMQESVTNPSKASEDLSNAISQGTDADRKQGRE